jgi:hypothetical protein
MLHCCWSYRSPDPKVLKDHNVFTFIYLLGLPDPEDEGTRSSERLETINL